MEIQNSVEDLISVLQSAIDDGRMYIDRLQEKIDEMDETKSTLENSISYIEETLSALDNLNGSELEGALDRAADFVEL